MSQQKEATCFVCGKQIYINKPYPDSKWVKTNLDGSAHVDPPRQQKQQIAKATEKMSSPEQKKDWEHAHDENMDRQDKLIASLDTLATEIKNLTSSNMSMTAANANLAQEVRLFKNVVADYLGLAKKESDA